MQAIANKNEDISKKKMQRVAKKKIQTLVKKNSNKDKYIQYDSVEKCKQQRRKTLTIT